MAGNGKRKDPKKAAAGKIAHESRMAMPLSRLAEKRAEAGWSKAKTADAAGMDPTTYSRIERCLVNPYPVQAEAIAKAFDVSVDDLTEGHILRTAERRNAPLELLPPMDPLVELGARVKKLEDDLDAACKSLGALKAEHEKLAKLIGDPKLTVRGMNETLALFVIDGGKEES